VLTRCRFARSRKSTSCPSATARHLSPIVYRLSRAPAEWDEAKTLPKELFVKASAAGWLPVCVGHWPTEYVGQPPAELKARARPRTARILLREQLFV
jgi:hypothetical protein